MKKGVVLVTRTDLEVTWYGETRTETASETNGPEV